MIIRALGILGTLFFIAMPAWTVGLSAEEPPDFERDIAPLLVNRCLGCHHPTKRSGGLDLSTSAGLSRGGDQGPALAPGNPHESLLWSRVQSREMPPVEAKEIPPLTKPEISRLAAWIAAGAAWPAGRELGIHEQTVDLTHARSFWSFQPVSRPEVPSPAEVARISNPIDLFITERLHQAGLSLSPRALPNDVLRRMSLDTRGLPPTLAEQEQFSSDVSPDAYERLIDRFLADPAYGERWARHWLDLVRYADSNGYERDSAKPSVWRYRDYVIAAFNSDKPYDRFIIEQLAGDELREVTSETLIATGFHALGTWQDEVDPLEAPQYRADELDDLIRTTSQAFLGLTLGCARCHNHKFDPLTMVDYYSLSAIFAPLKRPNKGRTDRDISLGTPEQIAAQAARDEKVAQLQKQITQLTKANPADLDHQLVSLRAQQEELKATTPDLSAAYRCYEDSGTAPATHLLLSGRASNPGPIMQARVPAVLTLAQPRFPPPAERSTLRRLTFANWLASADNPLTARVIVNRLWQHHFGIGLVATASDFGQNGARPTHPDLFDWLSHGFMHEGRWSLKNLHRQILTSETYRQTSNAGLAQHSVDPENRLLGHFPYRRLDIEALRDSMLAAAGNGNRQMYGPAVYLPIPTAAIEAHTDKQAAWHASTEAETNRRTVYAFVKRTLLVPLLETLDFCNTNESTERRAITSVAPQALTLFNGDFVNRQAKVMAERLVREAGPDADCQIKLAFRLALARPPGDRELQAMHRFLTTEARSTNDRSALEQLCRVILNLNEFVYPN